MPKINKHLSRIYRNPDIEPNKQKELDNSLNIWYDNLRVNPLYTYFSPNDIYDINEISSSVRLNNDPRKKYQYIGEIMSKRGFTFVGGGTNRRTYICNYDNRLVAKVGTDKIGFSNNLREYVNQDVLKPFCCKIFETSSCGTMALIERVYPITTIEEFQSVGYDIFEVLYFKLRNKDIGMEDIGFRSYQNWGIRDNFGPVLLDYPTMYVADPKKCFCVQRDSYGNYCNHPLDYDEGFDNIICTKCGHRYLSKSISKKNGDSIAELIHAAGNRYRNDKKGECKMTVMFVNKFGERVVKNLDDGKSDHVKQPYHLNSNNIYVPNSVEEPKFDFGARIVRDDMEFPINNQSPLIDKNTETIINEDTKFNTVVEINNNEIRVVNMDEVVDKVVNSLDKQGVMKIVAEEDNTVHTNKTFDKNMWNLNTPNKALSDVHLPRTLFNFMNNLSKISNCEISEIWYDHLKEIWDENLGAFENPINPNTISEMNTIEDAYSVFKITLNSITNSHEFYGKIIEFLALARFNCSLSFYCKTGWVDVNDKSRELDLENIFILDKLELYLDKVKEALKMVTEMGFKINELSPSILVNIFDVDKIEEKMVEFKRDKLRYLGLSHEKSSGEVIYTICAPKNESEPDSSNDVHEETEVIEDVVNEEPKKESVKHYSSLQCTDNDIMDCY